MTRYRFFKLMSLTAISLIDIVSITLLMGVGIEVANIFFATNVLEAAKVINLNIFIMKVYLDTIITSVYYYPDSSYL